MLYDPAIPFLGIHLKEYKSIQYRDTCTPIFITSLFIIARLRNQPKDLSTEKWILKNVVCIHNGVLFSHKKKEILSFPGKWMEMENIMLGEISQNEKDKYHMFSPICGI
jgi:hypothetical protein